MRASMRDRLLARLIIDPQTGCLIWTGSKTWNGYGRIRSDDRRLSTHRVMYEMYEGPIPDGLELDHLCRNRACANVAHLEPVTPYENQHRGLTNATKTHCVQGHAFDDKNTYKRRDGSRSCRKCRTIGEARRRAARKAER